MTRELPPEVAKEPILFSDALRLGLSHKQLRGPAFDHIGRSVYVPKRIRGECKIEAWLLVVPESAALYGLTAAEWYELPVRRDQRVHVIVPGGDIVPSTRAGLVGHEGLGTDDWLLHQGVRVTTPERTFLDLALVLPRNELVIAGDAMVRHKLTTPEDLQAAATAAKRKRGVVLARTAAALVQDRVDSSPETVVRLILVDGGLPCPDPGRDLFDDAGGWIGRPDLVYVLLKLAIQYEGDIHRTNQKRWRADVRRDEVLQDHGWDVIRVTAADVRRPVELCERVLGRMRRQAEQLGVDLRPLFGDPFAR